MAQNSSPNNMNEGLLIAVLCAIFVGALAALWFVASPIIGKIYAFIRIFETGGTWLLTGWGRYFWSVPYGKSYAFKSIFLSSVTFNIFFGVLVILIGIIAHYKIKEKHISSKIKRDKPMNYEKLMELQSKSYPANRFFLDYRIASEYSVSKGPARMPLTALELLMETDAIEGIHQGDTLTDPGAATGWKINEEAVTARLVRDFGPLNPFARKDFPFRNTATISEAISELPWHVVSILYASIARLYALDTMKEDYDSKIIEVDNFLKDVWREINKGKKQLGERLVLGFMDEDDRRLKSELAKAAFPKISDVRVQTLPEYLNEIIEHEGENVSRAEAFKTTQIARRELHRILTEYSDVSPDRLVYIKDHKGRFKRFRDLSKLELAQYEQVRKKQEQCVTEDFRELLVANGYQFGLLGTVLKATRTAGTLPPNHFRWMRFYDYPLWSYLRIIGMNTPTPEVAGMFDHTQTEAKSHMALTRPYLVSAVEGVRIEASKYITDEMREKFHVIQTQRFAREKTASVRPHIEAGLRSMAKDLAEQAKKRQASAMNRSFGDGSIQGQHEPTGSEF